MGDSPSGQSAHAATARPLVASLTLALAYAVVTGGSLAALTQLGTPAPLWPATGLGFAALAMRPRAEWRWLLLGIFAGAASSNLLFAYPPAQAFGLAAVNAVEPLVGVLLWRRLRSAPLPTLSTRGVLALVGAAAVGAAVGAALGVPLLWPVVRAPVLPMLTHWFVDDLLGVLVVGPALIAWWPGGGAALTRRLELAAILALLAVLGLSVVTRATDLLGLSLLYLTVPLLVWAALRTGPRGATAACLALSGVAAWGTLTGAGPLAAVPLGERAVAVQVFLFLNLLPVYALMGVVTTRDALHRALAERERQYARILEATHEGVWEIDTAGDTLYVNERMAEMLGCSPAEVVGRSVFELVHEADREALRERLASPEPSADYALRLRPRRGAPLAVEVTADAIEAPTGERRGAVALVRDVSEQRALRAQLEQAQKLEAIGMLASGIAHDFNNLLTSILAYSDMLVSSLPEGSEEADFAAQILDAAERGSDLTSRVLAFSRKQVLSLAPVDLALQVERSVSVARRLVGEHVALDVRLPAEPVPVEADPGQLDQVVLNLLVNARDAMPDGGRVELSVDVEANVARLRVRDEGCGITEENLAHIFEPFFTTKEVGFGTGLGLATCLGIVEQHGGAIRVASEVGVGTTFEIGLPLRRDLAPTADRARHEDERSALRARDGETLLLVEDDPQIFRMAHKILSNAGFVVLGRTSPVGALELMRERPTPVDLLVSDVVMPEMSGPELYAELRLAQPDLRALFVSGYPKDFLGAGGRVTESVELLLKPFTPVDLLRRVRAMLDASRRPPAA
ncbi:MAG: ATP-binding protein [Myxococcota bacterium]|nr:ATP-binding protein [Myxococcota bacterium]